MEQEKVMAVAAWQLTGSTEVTRAGPSTVALGWSLGAHALQDLHSLLSLLCRLELCQQESRQKIGALRWA